MHEHFRHVPVSPGWSRREVLRHLAEAGLEAGLAARAADAALGVADDARGAVHHPRLDQRPDGQVRRRRIAARIGDQPRLAQPVPAELRQPVDGLGQQRRLGVLPPCTSARSSRACAAGTRRSGRPPSRRPPAWPAPVPWRPRAAWPGRPPRRFRRTASAVQGIRGGPCGRGARPLSESARCSISTGSTGGCRSSIRTSSAPL